MRKSLLLLALIAAGCGSTARPSAPPDPMAGYSPAIRDYYGGVDLSAADDPNADAEVRYFQPPRPARAPVGATIRLTGANIGVQMEVTPTRVHTVGAYTAVDLELVNDGITVYDGELRDASLTFADGSTAPVARASASCSHGFSDHVRIDVGLTGRGCLLFKGGQAPKRLQLALETLPTEVGGVWTLRRLRAPPLKTQEP